MLNWIIRSKPLAVALGLEGRALKTAMQIPAEDLGYDNRMEMLLTKLDEVFLKEEKDQAYKA